MSLNIKRIFTLIAGIVLFAVVSFCLLKILPGIQTVEIDMHFDQTDQLRIYYSNSTQFREEAASVPQLVNARRSSVKVMLTGSFANYLRIDTGEGKGVVKIYQIKLASYFHPTLVLGPGDIGKLFAAGPGAEMQVFEDHVQVSAKNSDPYLIGMKRLFPRMYGQALGVALVSAALAVILLIHKNQKGVGVAAPAVAQASPGYGGERLAALDGLRGIAAMMVVADHTWGWFRGVGASGVWIFFALSGFLLARPFIDNPRAVLSFAAMAEYLRRRFMRILPMYYAYIFVVYVISGRFSLALVHGLFLEGDGHLWALPQEVIFYLLLPIVVLCVVLPLKKFPKMTMLALLVLMMAWNRYMGIGTIWLLGMNHIKLPLFFGVFLAGVFFSFVYSSCSKATSNEGMFGRHLSRTASLLGIAILVFFLVFSTGNIIEKKIVLSQKYFSYYGFLAGLLILCVLYAKGRVLDRLLTWRPFRELGMVGLSLYLVHPVVKNLIDGFSILYFGNKLKNIQLFLATLVCSYVLARYTFTHIEQPGFKSGKW